MAVGVRVSERVAENVQVGVGVWLPLSPTVSEPDPVGDQLREGEVHVAVGEWECGAGNRVGDHEADGVEVHDGEPVPVNEHVRV